jgi:sulfotransferase
MTRILYPEFKDNILLVDYNNLTTNTEDTLEKVYTFLGIEPYEHVLDNLKTTHTYTDHWGVKGHHEIKPKVRKTEHDLGNIFLPSTIQKYSGLEFWKDIG